ncbi:MAG: YegS/Rv2252/BmrU family lipid kinase [Defluviitaleaceae bacterium]|nr:YegS/Rv2252/BmrU family lipid kinase [Defluviitaleaceae bacterium]
MDTLKLIYNPVSGRSTVTDKHFKNAIDDCVDVFQTAGYETHLLRATSLEVLDQSIATMDEKLLVAAGGDGTINLVINALMRHKKDIPLGIIPAGTANDFASYLKMPKEPKIAAEEIVQGRIMKADLGLVNNKYFINVCGAGFLANVSQQVDTHFKDALGKMAYYLKGIGQLPNFMPSPLRISTPTQTLTDEFFLFLILNGSGAGGFDRLSTTAKIDDGMLDFIGFKAGSMIDIAALFLKVLSGDYLNDRRVLFLREKEILIEHINGQNIDTDVDGENGPDMPLNIECKKEAIRLFVPSMYR